MNRRAFDAHLIRVWHQATRDKCMIAVLMIDIDHFKQYNDLLGHQAGDAALRSVAAVLRGTARRPSDLAARYGGEEFVLVFYDVSLQHVLSTAEQIREAVQNLGLGPSEAIGGPRAPLTVSVGAGLAAPTFGRTPEGIIQLADEALYEAKNAGRNRTVIKGTDAYNRLNTGTFRRTRASRG